MSLSHLLCPVNVRAVATGAKGNVWVGQAAETQCLLRVCLDDQTRHHTSFVFYASEITAAVPGFWIHAVLAQAYVKAAPERMVWGSDWPHPSLPFDNKPDDAVLFDLLLQWAPNERERNRILADNPQTLYGFPKV